VAHATGDTGPALTGPVASAKVADPTIQAFVPPSTSIDLMAARSEEVPIAPDGGHSGIAMTDMMVKDNGSKGNLGTDSRPVAVAGLGASAVIPATTPNFQNPIF
jgi:hypothetical protein